MPLNEPTNGDRPKTDGAGGTFVDDHDGDNRDAPFEWYLHIVRTLNGFIIDGLDGTIVFEDGPERAGDTGAFSWGALESGEKLLWHIIEYFNVQGTKHDPARLTVAIEKKRAH